MRIVRVSVNRQDSHLRAERPFEEPARLDRRRVLDRGRDDVVAPVPVRKEDPLDGVVVRLAPAAGENDLRGIAAKEPRNLRTRLFQGVLRRHTGPMQA